MSKEVYNPRLTGVILMQATQKETQTTSNVKWSRRSQCAPLARA